MSIKTISVDTFCYTTSVDKPPRERVVYVTEENQLLIRGVDAQTGRWRSFRKEKIKFRTSRAVEFPGNFVF